MYLFFTLLALGLFIGRLILALSEKALLRNTYYLTGVISLLLSPVVGVPIFAQEQQPNSTAYDAFIENFQRNTNEAVWLLGYDRIAWISSDTAMTEPNSIKAKMGAEWFCYLDSMQIWHIFFGKLDTVSLNYEAAIHYTIDSKGRFKRSENIPNATLCTGLAKSIFYARYLLHNNTPSVPVNMNTYVRPQKDSIEVWFLPAILPNYTFPFGGEFRYVFDISGDKLLRKDIKYDKFYVVEPDTARKITLDYRKYAEPTVGGIFFVLQNYMFFKQITIETQWGLSGLLPNDNNPIWAHIPRSDLPPSFLDKDTETKQKQKKRGCTKEKRKKQKKPTKT